MHGKWIIIIGLILALAVFGAGCVTPPDTEDPGTGDGQEDPGTILSEEQQQVIVNDFESLLASGVDEKAAIAEIKNDLALLSPENINKMIVNFENYQKAAISAGSIVTQELIDLIQAKMTEPYSEDALNDAANIADPDLKAAIQGLLDRGYKIIVPEGMYEPVINYGVYRQFEDYATEDIKAYIEIMAAESDQRMSSDAAIIIPISDIYDRAVATENFLDLYPDSFKYDEVKAKYDNYVSAYIYGQNNTPAFDYETNTLKDEFKTSYKAAVENAANSALSQAVADYLVVLEENNYTLTNTVMDYRNTVVNSLTMSSTSS